VPPNANHKCTHTRLSSSHEISTKLLEEEEGRRWIFKLSSTPTKGTESLIGFLHIAMGERDERKEEP
jgi:hypothetical protein